MHPLVDFNVPAGNIAVHWFGQSSFALKTAAGTIVLVDPYFPHDRPSEKFVHADPPLDESELPVAGVLLTHDHGDHTHPETLARVREHSPDAVFVGPHESRARVREIGLDGDRFVTVEAGDCQTIGDLRAHVVYAKPPEGDASHQIDPPDVTHLGFVVEANGVRIYFSGDPINTFAEIDALVQPVKALAPQIGWLTCHPTEGEFPFFDGCVKMARGVGLKQVFPSHYQCFAQRNYDPQEWTRNFPADGPQPCTVEYNGSVLVPR